MLILGLESATAEVGCAIGGHEGVLASSHSARGKRHAENLTPAIEFVCRQARVELSEISCVAVDNGPGLFTGLRVGVASGKAIAQALRVPMISVSSLDLLAFPLRFSDRRIAAVIDARRNEVFWSFYRQVPGGIQRVSEPQVGSPDELAAELQAQPGDTLLAGDGAVRYADVLARQPGIEIAGGDHAYPSRSLVQLAHAKALREDWVRPEQIELLYLRKPDAEINWSVREGAWSSPEPSTAPVPSTTVTVSPMRRRHLPEVLAIEAQVYPRPWSSRLFENELERSNRVYLVARVGATVVGYAGLLMIADDGHVATIAIDPAWQRRGLARTLLVELVRGAMVLGANQLTLEVRMSNRGAQELYRSLGFAPAGARKAYYSDNGEDALVMWAHDIRTDDYERRLQSLAAMATGPVERHGFSPLEDPAPPHPAIAGGAVNGSTMEVS